VTALRHDIVRAAIAANLLTRHEPEPDKPLSTALKAALSAAEARGFCAALANIAKGTENETETAALLREATRDREEALRILARQLVDDGFRP
jgi:hypothetical protein